MSNIVLQLASEFHLRFWHSASLKQDHVFSFLHSVSPTALKIWSREDATSETLSKTVYWFTVLIIQINIASCSVARFSTEVEHCYLMQPVTLIGHVKQHCVKFFNTWKVKHVSWICCGVLFFRTTHPTATRTTTHEPWVISSVFGCVTCFLRRE